MKYVFVFILALVIIIVLSFVVVITIELTTNTHKCSKCGEKMKAQRRDIDGKWYKCPHCGNIEYFACYKFL